VVVFYIFFENFIANEMLPFFCNNEKENYFCNFKKNKVFYIKLFINNHLC